jgi:hypothetical protein
LEIIGCLITIKIKTNYSTTKTIKKMKRLILSILAGFLASGILASAVDHVFHTTGVYPPYGVPNYNNASMLLAFSYRVLFGVLGAYITTALAKAQVNKAVLILGIIGSVLWLVGAIAMWNYAPAWYNIIGVVTGIPIALIGKSLYQAKARRVA